MKTHAALALALLLLLSPLAALHAADASAISPGAPATHDVDKLAKDVANPVSSLISLPIQENIDFGLGLYDGWRSTTDIQPVYPASLSPGWNMINRAILPVIWQDDVTHKGEDFGLGDTTVEIFFSPNKQSSNGLIWGIGPALLLPTATKDVLGTGKWSAGPTALILKQDGKVTCGILANQLWSFAGQSARPDVSSTYIQPFFAYGAGRGRTYSINSESTYDWESKEWTIPVNVMASQILKFGSQLASVGIGFRYYLDKPDNGPKWGIRLTVQFLFPK